MPPLDGIRLAKKIRDLNDKVKIVLITAFYTDDMINNDECKKAKISEIFQKPMKMSSLKQRIIELVSY